MKNFTITIPDNKATIFIEMMKSISFVKKIEEEYSAVLTQHSMNLAQSSLAEDWDSENDEHWGSFL